MINAIHCMARQKPSFRACSQRHSIRTKLLNTGYDEALLAFADSKLRHLKYVHQTTYLDVDGGSTIRVTSFRAAQSRQCRLDQDPVSHS